MNIITFCNYKIDEIYNNYTDIELIETYRKTKDDRIIARIYLNYSALIQHIANRFSTIDDISTEALIAIQTALEKYDETKETKFKTYFYTILTNELLKIIINRKTLIRKANYNTLQLNESDILTDNNYLKLELQSENLTEKELIYCIMISEKANQSDVAEAVNCSKTAITNIKKDLRKKLKHWLK